MNWFILKNLVKHSIVSVSDNPTDVGCSSTLGLSDTSAEEDLPELVVGHDDAEEGEARNSEMGEGNLSGSERELESGAVAQDGDEGGLEEQGDVGVVVDHTLLGDRESTGLADHKISPLDAHNRDEVASLSVSQSFGGVADLGS